MAYYAIQYDLSHAKEIEYQKLWSEMDRVGAAKYQKSCYFLQSSASTIAVRDHFKAFIHEEDLLMVTLFTTRPSYTYALTPGHDWINARFT